jgi:hypothetical protein
MHVGVAEGGEFRCGVVYATVNSLTACLRCLAVLYRIAPNYHRKRK